MIYKRYTLHAIDLPNRLQGAAMPQAMSAGPLISLLYHGSKNCANPTRLLRLCLAERQRVFSQLYEEACVLLDNKCLLHRDQPEKIFMSNQPITQRPDGLTIISIWFYLCGAFFLFVTAAVAFLTIAFGIGAVADDVGMLIPSAIFGVIALAFMAMSILNLVVGYGLWIRKAWARVGAMALAIVGLLFMPIGTVAGALILWYLLTPEVAAVFDRPAA
jgi:hypothetical protein